MRASVVGSRARTGVAPVVLAAGSLVACSGSPGRWTGADATARPAVPAAAQRAPVYGNGSSITTAGSSGWTTPPAGGSVQEAPVPITSTWSAPPAPAPAAPSIVVPSAPFAAAGPTVPCPPTPAPLAAAPPRTWSGCTLPCADGLSMWHVRGAIGEAFSFGDDPIDECIYWGFDAGRTFCGCWGLDAFYRYHSGQLDRETDCDIPLHDGGAWHHVGVKLTYESAFGQSRLYWWAGVGPEYFWTQDYLDDDDGFGVFAEAGLGYMLNQTFRLRLGVNVHGMDTDVTRERLADIGESRWLWVVAPVAELEIDF